MEDYECLDQFFNYNEDEINNSDFSAQTNNTNGVVSSSVPNFQCDSLHSFQNEYQALPQIDGIGSLGHYIDHDSYSLENHYTNQGTSDVLNYPLPSFATTTSNGFHSLSHSQGSATTTQGGDCNGTGKPRLRARRGQATDPHSIAERLRREKIADRMKNLQELLPNPNKTDKASMLDEIIEYVKFLQLQVKVLSTSRLGAPDAVTDGQAEGGDNGLLLSPSSGQISDIVFPSDEVAFERELVRLMESNVTKAMQFLQTKGLCLMPVALASAVSANNNERESGAHNAVVGPDQRNSSVSLVNANELKPKV